MRFFVIAIVGGITGGLVHRLDIERSRFAELAYTDALTRTLPRWPSCWRARRADDAMYRSKRLGRAAS